ncbi:hypothetical protein BV20DRAFT_998653, partial [Pilatotrama ljubarskyi]
MALGVGEVLLKEDPDKKHDIKPSVAPDLYPKSHLSGMIVDEKKVHFGLRVSQPPAPENASAGPDVPSNLRDDSGNGQEPPAGPLPADATSTRRSQDGRLLPSVEVVLPSYAQVKRMRIQASRAQESENERRRSGSANMSSADRPMVSVKAEPRDDADSKPLLDLDKLDPLRIKEVLRAAVEDMKNPDIKVKAEMLSDEALLDALTWEGMNYRYPIPVPPEIANYPLRRDYISNLYGGNIQETAPRPRKDLLEWHGLDDWFFLSLDYNPHAPQKPGFSGLFFGGNHSGVHVERTFVRMAPGRWVYMGQYRVEPGKALSREAWHTLTPNVRRTWAKGILGKEWGVDRCINIWLKRGKEIDWEPSQDEWEDAALRIKEIRNALSEDDVIGAFDRGTEVLWTRRMTCVGYDEEFQRVLVRNADRFLEAKTVGGAKGGAKGKSSKRKAIEVESDSEMNHRSMQGLENRSRRQLEPASPRDADDLENRSLHNLSSST